MKFLRCKICGQILGVVKDKGITPICCNEPMEVIEAKTEEKGLQEKHVPVYLVKKGQAVVKIGSIPHPMSDDHYIEWVALETSKGNQRKSLKPGDTPKVYFNISDDEEVIAIYAYCNVHSLWKLDVKSYNQDVDCK